MAQYDNNIQPNNVTLLRDMLRLIAQNPDLDTVAPAILGEARSITRAEASFCLIFDEPRALFVDSVAEERIPSDKVLTGLAADLGTDIHVSSELPPSLGKDFTGWVVVPLVLDNETAGVFCLLFKKQFELSDEMTESLMSLAHGLAIVTQNAKVDAHHDKLTRNQYEFVRIVSHDLRSPLTSIKGFASMLEGMMGVRDDEETIRQLHFVEKILSGVAQMTLLVDNIQDAGRYDPETGFYEMQRSPTDLYEMVRNIVKNHLVPAEKEALTLKVAASDDIPIINVDANMMERSIINLVDNAIKYTPNGGTIEVGLRRQNEDILITVHDDGYGIEEENLKNLFQRHFRIRRREHKRVKGSGLGLFIVRSVARRHGGDAFVESEVGNGSTFGIRVPLKGENLLGSVATEAD